MAIQQVIQLAIAGVQGVVSGFKKVFKGARGLFRGFGELKNSLVQNLTPAYNVFVEANERLNLELLKTQGNVAANARVFDQFGNEIDDLSERIQATRPALRAALIQLEEDTRELVGVTTQQVNEAFSIVLENIGRLGGQSKVFADPLESAIALSRGVVASLGAIGLPLQQVRQEFRALIQGDLRDRNAILAQTLNISRREFNLAKSNGELVDFLNEKLQVFIETNKLQAETITGISSNILDVFQIITRELGAPLLDPIAAQLKTFDKLLQENRATLVRDYIPSFETLGRIVAQVLDIFNSLAAGLIALFTNPVISQGINILLRTIEATIEPVVQLLSLLQRFDGLAGVFDFAKNANDDVETFGESLDNALELSIKAARALNKEFDNFFKARGTLSDVTVDVTKQIEDLENAQDKLFLQRTKAIAKQFNLTEDQVSQLFQSIEADRERFGTGGLVATLVGEEKAREKVFDETRKDIQKEIEILQGIQVKESEGFGRRLLNAFSPIRLLNVLGRQRAAEAANAIANEQQLLDDLEKLRQENFNSQQAAELAELTQAKANGKALSDAEAVTLQTRRVQLRTFNIALKELLEERVEGLSGAELQAALEQNEIILRAFRAQAAEFDVIIQEGPTIGDRFFLDLGDVGTQVREQFDDLGRALVEAREKNAEELSKTTKEFVEALNTGLDFGVVTEEEAIERIDEILGRQRLLFSDQIALLEARNKVIKRTTKENIDALELEIEQIGNLVAAGTIDEFTGSVAELGAEADKSRATIKGLRQEQEGLNKTFEQAEFVAEAEVLAEAIKALEDAGFEDINIDAIILDEEQIKDVQARATAIRTRASKEALRIENEIALETEKIRGTEIKANSEFFKERTRQLEEFLATQKRLLDQSIQVRRTQEIALTALLEDAAIERRQKTLELTRETEEERLEQLIQGLEGRVNILREAPTLTVEEEREGLIDIEEKINEILGKQNDLFQNAVDQAKQINELRAKAFETEQEIDQLERDAILNREVRELEQQSTLLGTALSRTEALADLDKARLEFTRARREQQETENERVKELLDLQLALIQAQMEGTAEEIKSAREAVQERAKELGIRVSVFESERSIRAKIAAQERRQQVEARKAERERLEELKAQFEAERRQQAVQQEQERIQNRIAQTQAEANLANQEAELAALRFQREQLLNQREAINIALEQQKIELEAAKARLLAIKEEVRARIEGEGIVAAARQAAEAAAEREGDPRDAVGGFLEQLDARIDAGIAGIDQQIGAIDEQIAVNKELSKEQQLQLDLLDKQIEAKEAAIAATKDQIAFLKEEAQAQEEINRILDRTLRLRQRAAAATAGFTDRGLQRQAEQAAAQPFNPPSTARGVEQGERRRRGQGQEIIDARTGERRFVSPEQLRQGRLDAGLIEEGVSRGVDSAIQRGAQRSGLSTDALDLFRDPRNQIQFGTGFGDAMQQARIADINRSIQDVRSAVQAAQPASNTTINNNTTVSPVQLVNPSASSRKSGR